MVMEITLAVHGTMDMEVHLFTITMVTECLMVGMATDQTTFMETT